MLNTGSGSGGNPPDPDAALEPVEKTLVRAHICRDGRLARQRRPPPANPRRPIGLRPDAHVIVRVDEERKPDQRMTRRADRFRQRIAVLCIAPSSGDAKQPGR